MNVMSMMLVYFFVLLMNCCVMYSAQRKPPSRGDRRYSTTHSIPIPRPPQTPTSQKSRSWSSGDALKPIAAKPDSDQKISATQYSVNLSDLLSKKKPAQRKALCTNSIFVEDVSKAVCHPEFPECEPIHSVVSVEVPFKKYKIMHYCYGPTVMWKISFEKVRQAMKASLIDFDERDCFVAPGHCFGVVYDGYQGYEVMMGSSRETLDGICDTPDSRKNNRIIRLIQLPSKSLQSDNTRLKILWYRHTELIYYLVKDLDEVIHRIVYGARRTIFCDTSCKQIYRCEDTILLGDLRHKIASNESIAQSDSNLFLKIECVERTPQGNIISVDAGKYTDCCKKLLHDDVELPYAAEKYAGRAQKGGTLHWLVTLSKAMYPCCRDI